MPSEPARTTAASLSRPAALANTDVLKYSLVTTRQTCTGERSCPTWPNPYASAVAAMRVAALGSRVLNPPRPVQWITAVVGRYEQANLRAVVDELVSERREPQ